MVAHVSIRRSPYYKPVLVVIFLLLALWVLARALYVGQHSIQRSRERVLQQNLFTLRSLIQQYTLDKKKAPQSLEDLVSAGYLKQIPKDPSTGKPDWKVERISENSTGIVNVQSSSPGIASDGTRYSSW